jgi:flagellar hook protein FlgE
MSLYSAIGSAVSGLAAQSASLNNISNNIANASTVGYKQADTAFESMVYAAGAGSSATAGGVATTTSNDIGTAGQLVSTGVNTDIAVSGRGFLVVNTNAASANGNYLLTRAGSFRPDANGNLVNSGGGYLQGQALNADGSPVSAASTLSALTTVNVSKLTAAGAPTTMMTFAANLPAAETAFATTAPTPSTSSMTYYDALGASQSLRFEFSPTLPAAAGDANTNGWTMNIYDSAASTPTSPIGTATLAFNGTGANAGTLASVTPTGGAGAYDSAAGTLTITTASGQNLPIKIGGLNSPSGLTQFDGSYQTTQLSQNGAGFGLLQGVSIGSGGVVSASFSNGTTRPIYQLSLVTVPNPDGLTPTSGNAYQISSVSGAPLISTPGQGATGTIDAGQLEGSNVDITTQLTNMIETQRAYSSNAMVIQTGKEMLDTINRLNA